MTKYKASKHDRDHFSSQNMGKTVNEWHRIDADIGYST